MSIQDPTSFFSISAPIIANPFNLWSKKRISKIAALPYVKSNTFNKFSLGAEITFDKEKIKQVYGKKLIQVIDESPELSNIKTSTLINHDQMDFLSNRFFVYKKNQVDENQTLSENVLSLGSEMEVSLNRLVTISNTNIENSDPLLKSISSTIFLPLLFLYQYLDNVLSVLDSKMLDLASLSLEGSESIRIFKNKVKLYIINVLTVISRMLELNDVSFISNLIKIALTKDKLAASLENQSDLGHEVYPLFAIDNEGRINLVYTNYYPEFMFNDSHSFSQNKSGTNSFYDFYPRGEMNSKSLDDEHLIEDSSHYTDMYQSRINMSTLANLSVEIEEGLLNETGLYDDKALLNLKQVFASLFINLLNEYSSLHDQMDKDEPKNTEPVVKNTGSLIQILEEPQNSKSDEIYRLNNFEKTGKNKNGYIKKSINVIDLSQSQNNERYAYLGQVLLDMVETLGPGVLSNRTHILAFIDSIMSKVTHNPPPLLNEASPSLGQKFDIQNRDSFSTKGGFPSGDKNLALEAETFFSKLSLENQGTDANIGDNEAEDVVTDSVNNSEQLILALNLLYTLEITGLDQSQYDGVTSSGVSEKKENKDEGSVSRLYYGIEGHLKILKTQWKNYPLVFGLLEQAESITKKYTSDKQNSGIFGADKLKLEEDDSGDVVPELSEIMADLQSDLIPIVAYGLVESRGGVFGNRRTNWECTGYLRAGNYTNVDVDDRPKCKWRI
ncbi:hypothetical protein AYI68_g1798 [Smittium mucronatum]|uniref:Uncharacterized protein n=1 Tax=Smittium mucronatum TaxID=133383 RepID=A0A1R0H4K9_9FUNG|nr:hypothetical protein AYI68_g1798 [Smittium mucronatum]